MLSSFRTLVFEIDKMPVTFTNSPIVELIAEFHWETACQAFPGGSQTAGAAPAIVDNPSAQENFFMRFSGHVFPASFQQLERVVPHGFPLFAHQPVFRFRSKERPQVLYQVGPGFFSANALPPYKTWESFVPVVREGIAALLLSRDSSEQELPFSLSSLRYIDAFRPSLTNGLDIASFMTEVLGIQLALPDGVRRHSDPEKTIKQSLQLQVPTKNGATMYIGIGEGLANGELAYMMDTRVIAASHINADVDSAMQSLDVAHGIIHDLFFDVTKPIAELMNPVEEV